MERLHMINIIVTVEKFSVLLVFFFECSFVLLRNSHIAFNSCSLGFSVCTFSRRSVCTPSKPILHFLLYGRFIFSFVIFISYCFCYCCCSVFSRRTALAYALNTFFIQVNRIFDFLYVYATLLLANGIMVVSCVFFSLPSSLFLFCVTIEWKKKKKLRRSVTATANPNA